MEPKKPAISVKQEHFYLLDKSQRIVFPKSRSGLKLKDIHQLPGKSFATSPVNNTDIGKFFSEDEDRVFFELSQDLVSQVRPEHQVTIHGIIPPDLSLYDLNRRLIRQTPLVVPCLQLGVDPVSPAHYSVFDGLRTRINKAIIGAKAVGEMKDAFSGFSKSLEDFFRSVNNASKAILVLSQKVKGYKNRERKLPRKKKKAYIRDYGRMNYHSRYGKRAVLDISSPGGMVGGDNATHYYEDDNLDYLIPSIQEDKHSITCLMETTLYRGNKCKR